MNIDKEEWPEGNDFRASLTSLASAVGEQLYVWTYLEDFQKNTPITDIARNLCRPYTVKKNGAKWVP